MGSSQVLRWIDELNGITDSDEKARNIKAEIRKLKRDSSGTNTRREIRKLYAQLDSVQFKPDYMCLIIDREKDYRRACKGFSINGMSYSRLLGTAGGIKNSTIVFVSDRHHDELVRRIDNGRNMDMEMVPAKLEAYKALACSASIPVSMPNGILVVKDAETTFNADVVYLDDECDGEPTMQFIKDKEIVMDASDGYGLMLPSLAERWSKELGLSYTMCGCNTRMSFEKGMVYAFDFIDFAKNVAHKEVVKDVWGNDVNINDVELILTESMLKLWNAYKSCDDYLENCAENGYTIGIPKTCPEKLENTRTLNYQFIQSYSLNDSDIDELIAPTVLEINDVLSGDWRKSVLFLKGSGLSANNIDRVDDGFIKAIMVDNRIANDPYVQSAIYQLIKNRINEAKIGVLNVHGNYSMISGDPYTLCQSIFGMQITGILKAGEIYNKYWADEGSEKLACFRAPMSTHENIRVVSVNRSDSAKYWYRYMTACTILNSWDTMTMALNGCDYDGDLVMLTDNDVLIRNHRNLPAIMCVQRKAKKMVPTEEDTVNSNIASFGNEIGQVTNRTTSMYEVQSRYNQTDKEYNVLSYRIMCGQLIQQNVIDKAKGIVAKPMPKTWYDRHAISQISDDNDREFYRSIVADRKAYFMRYIYPDLMKQYNTYISNTNKNALREFQMTVQELKDIPYGELDDRQKEFLYYYDLKLPVGVGNCVMNRICKSIEKMFDGFVGRFSKLSDFDYTIMKSGSEYTKSQFYAIKKLYDEYNKKLQSYSVYTKYERPDEDESTESLKMIKSQFLRECTIVCPDPKKLCDLSLDLCYQKSKTKKFVWDICGEQIVENLLEKNGRKISYPTLCPDGEFEYSGNRYTIETKEIPVLNEYNIK